MVKALQNHISELSPRLADPVQPYYPLSSGIVLDEADGQSIEYGIKRLSSRGSMADS